MKNKLLSAGILGLGLIASATIVANGAYAQTTPDTIKYPVAELGNCKDKDACKTYCDDASHTDACLAFAQENNLMSQSEIDIAKKFTEAGSKGPGDCTGKEACQTYCDNTTHIDECVAFAEKTGMLPPEQLAEAKQVQAAIAKGVKPPACNGKKECDAYCEDSSHMKECIAFGEAAGFLQGKDLEDAKKVLTAIDNGATPPACKGKEECDAYCSDRSHIETCMTFAQVAGLMTPEEAQNSDKMLAAIKKGIMPPDCSGKEACDAYCAEPAHTDECINFSVAAGFMTEKEAEMAKKTGGKGPGGGFNPTTENGGTGTSIRIGNCATLSECQTYCDSHQTECQAAGIPDTQECVSGMPGYDMGKCQSYCSDHQDLCDLARYNVGRSGNSPQGSQQGEQGSQQGQNQQNQNQQGQSGNKPQSGSRTVNPGGQQMPQQASPGGCKGPEACAAYCKDHLKECQEFVPPGSAGSQTGPANQQPNQQQQQGQQQNQQPNQQQDQQQQQGQQQNQQQNQQQDQQQNQQQQPQQQQNQPPQPEGQQAPQSFNFDLDSPFAAVITAFQGNRF